MLRDFTNKIKGKTNAILQEWFVIIVVVFIGIIAFGLGRISAVEESVPPISISENEQTSEKPMNTGGWIVASRAGSKYHFPWCPGAKQMSERNKIWFESEEEARQRGYTPAGNCKGLE